MRLFDRLIAGSLPILPRRLVRWVANPYIAGETTEDALRTIAELSDRGAAATLDLLGEEIHDPELARGIAARYREMLAEIAKRDLASGVSVKLSGLGLRIAPGLARELCREVVRAAREAGRFVRIDMEDASTTDETLALFRSLREEGFTNVGVVLQACLCRTWKDARELARLKADVRLVKGIYIEPESISWRDPEVIRQNFVRVLRLLLTNGCRVGIATHDDRLLYAGEALLEDLGIPREQAEFQMLLGVREQARDLLIGRGHRMRVYVPFGERWYEYSVRRLRENPAVAGHVTRQLMGRIFRRRR